MRWESEGEKRDDRMGIIARRFINLHVALVVLSLKTVSFAHCHQAMPRYDPDERKYSLQSETPQDGSQSSHGKSTCSLEWVLS